MKSICSLAFFICTSALAGVFQPLSTAPQLLIPAAGSVEGANGTFFHSDIALVNFATHDQIVRLEWLPEGATGASSTTITISAQNGFRSSDFVLQYLHQSGLGAIVITGVTSTGALDSTAALFASSRIWTPQPGGAGGTTSQSLPAIPVTAINTPQFAALFGVGGLNGNYRLNVGIVNLDPVNSQTFSVSYAPQGPLPASGTQVIVPPKSMQQIPFGSGPNFYPPEIVIANVTPSATQSTAWIAYGSTVDNITGDAWTELSVIGAPIFTSTVIW